MLRFFQAQQVNQSVNSLELNNFKMYCIERQPENVVQSMESMLVDETGIGSTNLNNLAENKADDKKLTR